MQMIKPENSSQGGAAKGKGQWLGDLVITNRHSAQPDVHRWRVLKTKTNSQKASAKKVINI
jgi:hypothetical protein